MPEELKSGTKRKPSGNQWVRRSTCFQTSEVDREKNFTSLSRNLSKVAPHVLAPILNVQTSHFVKVLFVISFSQSRDGVNFFWTQGAFSELFCRGVVKQRKWTEKLGILCRCICEGRWTSIHRCRKSSRVVQNVNQTAIFEFEGQPVFRRRKLTDRRPSHFFLEICHNFSPHLLAPFLTVQTSHFVKLFLVTSLSQFQNACEWFSHARRFFRAFLSRSQKTTKMDWKTWNFVSMYLRRSLDVHSPMS